MTEIALETVGLTRYFGQRCAVSDLNLRVEVGDIYGFLGPNGAGKTTAIRCILGLLRRDDGEVRIFGDANPVRQRRHVGALVETPSFHPWLSAVDNLRRAADFSGQGSRKDIDMALDVVGLKGREHNRVSSYSLGMRQRLGIARTLLGSPRLLILDEPTNGLDPRGMKEVREVLQRMASERQMTVFISSHLLGEVEQLCSRVGIIEKGKLIAEGTPEALAARQQPCVEIGATDPQALTAALNSMVGVTVQETMSNGRLRVVLTEEMTAAVLNRQLLERGVAVDALVPVRENLESLFLSLTSAELT